MYGLYSNVSVKDVSAFSVSIGTKVDENFSTSKFYTVI